MDYDCGRPMIIIVDTSPTGIGWWAVGQDDEDDRKYVIRFGAKVLSIRQRNYPQIKRELWGVVGSSHRPKMRKRISHWDICACGN